MFEKLKEGKELSKFQNKWISIMANLGKYNKRKDTFSLNNIEKTEYGYRALILIVDGLRYKELDEVRDAIEDAYGCMCIFNKKKRSNLIAADFIFTEPRKDKFKPINGLKPWEIYLGNSYNGKPIIVSMVEWPHILISGGTRSGKSKMTDCIITTLLCNCNEEQLELYLAQVAKSDLCLYEDAIQCRAFADSLDKTLVMLKHIKDKMQQRDKLIRPFRKQAKADNYLDYNKINKSNPLSTVYVIFDETSSLFQTKGSVKDDKDIKEEIVDLIKEIAQYGAGLGVFLLCSLQRPTAENLDPFVKSQSTCNISFRQNNAKSSEVAMGDSEIAIGLEQREFVYSTKNNNYGIVPLVKNKEVYGFIKDYLKPNHRNLFHDLKKLMMIKSNGREEIKESEKPRLPQEFTEVEQQKSKEEIVKENIAKIPNFVPYKSLDGMKVIEEPKISNNTEKPRRGGKEKI